MKAGDTVVIASTNPGKIAEVRQILAGLPLVLLTSDDVGGWPEIEETGDTYLANALLKARAVASVTGRAVLADDSGIEVDALDGAPGVRSARFSGERASDEDNNAKLIESLDGVPYERRSARYRCVAVLVTPNGEEIAGIGSCEGRIGFEPRGTGGFGYDPWFVPEHESRTMAELTAEEKHAISHRGKALRGLADKLRDLRGERSSG
ncbi:MAG: XTP/dITP diphosphohydrolase [Actinomycetota bacterium]|jgi:XTP/dITP diphosphohydrolase|nr:XTP/dITP diphosphohydrolase [Actinomycetota bacterium]